jgi:hypothetical protein
MSVPHTGRLIAIVEGLECRFDGDHWETPSRVITRALNEATESSPKTHFDIRDLAVHVLTKLGFTFTIESWSGDEWEQDDAPEGTVE